MSTKTSSASSRRSGSIARWFDTQAAADRASDRDPGTVDWVRCVPFILLHAACLTVIWVGWSWTAIGVATAAYLVRMFAITGFYHRYFSHRTFRTSRAFQFLMALVGSAAGQRGPMWWAAHHRHHHNHSDEEDDIHSPLQRGFWMSHAGWFMTHAAFPLRERYARDWQRFRELQWLDRFDWIAPALLAGGLYGLGVVLARVAPDLGTSGGQLFIWGFVISTLVLYHATYTINSLAHKFGRQRFDTGDDSRNNFWLALVTLGEGWHNNHHHYPAAARQGFYWWEIDLTYYGLLLLAKLGLIWDLNPVSERALAQNRIDESARS